MQYNTVFLFSRKLSRKVENFLENFPEKWKIFFFFLLYSLYCFTPYFLFFHFTGKFSGKFSRKVENFLLFFTI